MKTLGIIITLTLLVLVIGFLSYQNLTLSSSNERLVQSNEELSEKADMLTSDLENVTRELTLIKQNYSAPPGSFVNTSSPLIETRLGIELVDRVTLGDNYLWVTGEVENKEDVAAYNVVLNFTLYTYQGIDTDRIVIGTLEPHQVVDIRTSVMTSLGKIVNWTLEPTATYLQ